MSVTSHALAITVMVLSTGIASVCGAESSVPVIYAIVDLGALEGGYARARSVNSMGQVVGEFLLSGDALVQRAFIWDGGTARDLGSLGGPNAAASDINDSGVACGWSQDADGTVRPVLWERQSTRVLPTLGGMAGAAWSVNSGGTSVGYSEVASGVHHATVWRADGTVDLGTLGGTLSVAYDVNVNERVVGSAYDKDGVERASLWQDGAAADLGSIADGAWSTARAINDAGEIILWGIPAGGVSYRASFWTGDAGSPVIDLGTFGGSESWAYGLNNAGFVVGWAGKTDGTYEAFVWDGERMSQLGTLGGHYSSAYGINDEGLVVGFAQDGEGATHAVMWVPVPEPRTGVTLLAGMAGLVFVWRRSR